MYKYFFIYLIVYKSSVFICLLLLFFFSCLSLYLSFNGIIGNMEFKLKTGVK